MSPSRDSYVKMQLLEQGDEMLISLSRGSVEWLVTVIGGVFVTAIVMYRINYFARVRRLWRRSRAERTDVRESSTHPATATKALTRRALRFLAASVLAFVVGSLLLVLRLASANTWLKITLFLLGISMICLSFALASRIRLWRRAARKDEHVPSDSQTRSTGRGSD